MRDSIIKLRLNFDVPECDVINQAQKEFLSVGFIVQQEDIKIELTGSEPSGCVLSNNFSFSDWILSSEYYITKAKIKTP